MKKREVTNRSACELAKSSLDCSFSLFFSAGWISEQKVNSTVSVVVVKERPSIATEAVHVFSSILLHY